MEGEKIINESAGENRDMEKRENFFKVEGLQVGMTYETKTHYLDINK